MYLFWSYCNEFLTYSADYVGDMSRDISFGGVQQNIAFYPLESLLLYIGGFLLISYLLIQNEFSNLFDEPRENHLPKSADFLQNMYFWIVLSGMYGLITSSSGFTEFSVLTLLVGLIKAVSAGLFIGFLISFFLRGN